MFVYGVPAYSTLGWFDDPVLNTFIRYPDAELARLVFHELAHQVVYVKGDTTFNESFAVAVEEEGLRRWLARERERGGARGLRRLPRAPRGVRRSSCCATASGLRSCYREPLPDDAKRAGKAKLFAELDADYRELKTKRLGRLRRLRPVLRRHEQRPPRVGRHLRGAGAGVSRAARAGGRRPAAKFYAAVKALAALDKPARERELAALDAPLAPPRRLPQRQHPREHRDLQHARCRAAPPRSPPARSARRRPETRAAPRRSPTGTRTTSRTSPKLSAVITRPDIATGKCGVITAKTSAPDMTVKP